MSKSSKKSKNNKAAGSAPAEKSQEKKVSFEIINESDTPAVKDVPAKAPVKEESAHVKAEAPAKTDVSNKQPEAPAKAEPEKKAEAPAKAEPEKKTEVPVKTAPEKKPAPAVKAEPKKDSAAPAKAEEKPLPVLAPAQKPANDKNAQKAAEKKAKEQQKALAKQQKETEKARQRATKEAEKQNPDFPAKERVSKKRYGEVMTTGQFLGTLILMLIPGINIICVLIWALGGSKNRNRVNFTRGAILFFLIEILLTAAVLGGGIVYAQSQQTRALKYLDNQTGGLLTYMNVDSYQDLTKIRDVHKYLIDKDAENVEVPPTRVIENPEGINSYEDFMALYDVYTGKEAAPEADTSASDSENADSANADQTETSKPKTLKDILAENDIDTTKSGLVYIVLDNGNNDCVICFDPSGKIQNVPTIQMNSEVIYVGGAK